MRWGVARCLFGCSGGEAGPPFCEGSQMSSLPTLRDGATKDGALGLCGLVEAVLRCAKDDKGKGG